MRLFEPIRSSLLSHRHTPRPEVIDTGLVTYDVAMIIPFRPVRPFLHQGRPTRH